MEQKKIQMNISDKGLQELKDLQEKVEASTMSDVIRSSIKLFKYLQEQKRLGNEVIIRERATHKEKELII